VSKILRAAASEFSLCSYPCSVAPGTTYVISSSSMNIPINQTVKQLDYSLIKLIMEAQVLIRNIFCYPELNKESSVNRAVSGILV
jgi:hypothetical protein